MSRRSRVVTFSYTFNTAIIILIITSVTCLLDSQWFAMGGLWSWSVESYGITTVGHTLLWCTYFQFPISTESPLLYAQLSEHVWSKTCIRWDFDELLVSIARKWYDTEQSSQVKAHPYILCYTQWIRNVQKTYPLRCRLVTQRAPKIDEKVFFFGKVTPSRKVQNFATKRFIHIPAKFRENR